MVALSVCPQSGETVVRERSAADGRSTARRKLRKSPIFALRIWFVRRAGVAAP
jgi:hypothetical protein